MKHPCYFLALLSMTFIFVVNTLVGAEVTPTIASPEESYRLVDGDEFNGTELDEKVWQSEEPGVNSAKNTYRGPENVKMGNGELHLRVTKEPREGAEWAAASVYRVNPIENGAYVECRFKPTECSGVNNAFWLSSRPFDKGGISNRYELDVVETRLDSKSGLGRGHLAWHDWKGFDYIKNEKNKKDHIAQGIQIDHEWNAYQVWGYQIEDGMMRWFLNGKQVWEGEVHDKYPDQHRTGVGKFNTWFPNKEKEAYGRFGQLDWDYRKGYSGDNLHIILSTMPWSESWTPLTDQANNTEMRVDYVRVFMPERLLNKTPLTTIPFAEGKVQCPPVFKEKKGIKYYGMMIDTTAGHEIKVNCIGSEGETLLSIGSKEGVLRLVSGTHEASSETVFASPWKELTQMNRYKGPMQLILRLTPTSLPGTSIASICLFPSSSPDFEKEPVWYHNVDEKGNTSVNNRWHLNLSITLQNEISRFSVEGSAAAQKLKMASNYCAVIDLGK